MYKLKCKDCNAVYVEQTKRLLSTTINKHLKNPSKSRFGFHLKHNSHNFCTNKLHNVRHSGRRMNLLENMMTCKTKKKKTRKLYKRPNRLLQIQFWPRDMVVMVVRLCFFVFDFIAEFFCFHFLHIWYWHVFDSILVSCVKCLFHILRWVSICRFCYYNNLSIL